MHLIVKRILWSYISLVIFLALVAIPQVHNYKDLAVFLYCFVIYFFIAAVFSTRDYFRAKREGTQLWW